MLIARRPHYRRVQILAVSMLAVTAIVLWTRDAGWSQTASPAGQADSLAAWEKIAAVLQHPRCLNCHQLNAPLQGDARKPHAPRVVRGPDSHGISAMRCGNCHSEAANNPTSRVPGALHWQLAPPKMSWQGLSVADLCRTLKNPALNGNRSPEALIHHMQTDKLVLWGWDPGQGRAPVPISHQEFLSLLKVWVAGRSGCPS